MDYRACVADFYSLQHLIKLVEKSDKKFRSWWLIIARTTLTAATRYVHGVGAAIVLLFVGMFVGGGAIMIISAVLL